MTDSEGFAAVAKEIIESSLYLTLGTADAEGRPWASPVYYAVERHAEFIWVSSPDATHSHNLGARPEVSIVIFDSRAPIGTGQGVYMTAVAEEVPQADTDRVLGIYSRRSQAHGGNAWTRAEIEAPARHRLYHAIASQHWVLGPRDERIAVDLE